MPLQRMDDPGTEAVDATAIAGLDAILSELLDRELSKRLADQAPKPAPVPERPSYKKHYRCDQYPNLRVQMLDMSALDRGERPQAYPIAGEYIQFRFGHFYTNDDNVIRQIEHFMPLDRTQGNVNIGGLPEIYEDDGIDIHRCPVKACEYVTASDKAMTAHMRAVHHARVSE